MKTRADLLLVKQNLAASRSEAQALILAGQVSFSKGRIEKAGQLISEEEILTVRKGRPFVSRGGEKLQQALETFHLNVTDKTCLDIGASTGGFTDCLLQNGAKKIYAVDVGYGQFHWKLRSDPRVVLMEKTNFRYIESGKIPEKLDLIVIDVSFISLDKILPKAKEHLKPEGQMIVLIKPQFELSPKEVGKGVVKDEGLRQKTVQKIKSFAEEIGLQCLGTTASPILGPKGNQEFLMLLSDSDSALLQTP